jgi:hypothetical protein
MQYCCSAMCCKLRSVPHSLWHAPSAITRVLRLLRNCYCFMSTNSTSHTPQCCRARLPLPLFPVGLLLPQFRHPPSHPAVTAAMHAAVSPQQDMQQPLWRLQDCSKCIACAAWQEKKGPAGTCCCADMHEWSLSALTQHSGNRQAC